MLANNITQDSVSYFRKNILKWGKANYQSYPWRDTNNLWHALTAETMLQRTKAEQVLQIFNVMSEKYLNPQSCIDDNYNPFVSLGLYWRQKYFKDLCSILSKQEIPRNKQKLLELPGIGDYIASAYLSLHCNIRSPIIDSNIVRIYGKYFGFHISPETRRTKWIRELAEEITPTRNFKKFNYALLDFAMIICKPKTSHANCPLKKKCNFYLNNRTESKNAEKEIPRTPLRK